MTQEEKDILIKDLCARLPYGVKILHEGWNYELDDEFFTVERVVGIDDKFIYTKVIDTHNGEEYRDDKWPIDTFDGKLYLRPMSSMTEEEEIEYDAWYNSFYIDDLLNCIDWFNAHYFDYRNLIEKGLAIEATEGMYS